MTTIVWFRRDLRLHYNPALAEAASRGTVLPVFLLDPAEPGGASRWWLHHSLKALRGDLPGLAVFRGDALALLVSQMRGLTGRHCISRTQASAAPIQSAVRRIRPRTPTGG